MIDLHSHILPYVDDGSKDMEMSLQMARIYVENGFRKVIATPHYVDGANNSTTEDIRIGLEALKKELARAGIPLEIYLGNEIYTAPNIIDDIINNNIIGLNDSKYLLMELPMNDIPLFVEDLIYEILIKGYIPIIAHPERNSKIINDPNILYRYINMGALAQMNLTSLEGFYGSRVKNTAELLLTHSMIHFVSTDSHSNRGRSPKVENSLKLLKTLVDHEYYEKITAINPQLVLDNKSISINSPIELKKRKIGFKGLTTFFAKF